MSHFTVMVIGDAPEKQLQPFHEYECTGIKDEFVYDVDYTEKVNEWLDRELLVGISKQTGELDYHYHEENAKSGLISYEPMKQRDYILKKGENIDDAIIDYHGVEKKDGKWVRFTNPNKKWDWYQLGGRWSGMIKVKEGAMATVGNGSLVFQNEAGIDQAKKADITNFDEIKTFAILKDGKWYERGEMGWWGAVHDEKDEETWQAELAKLKKEIPDNTLISIYDCHI